jgi:hypothetical protein
MKRFLLAILMCTAPLPAQTPAMDPRIAAGCGPLHSEFSVKVDKNDHNLLQPDPGKALVYVIVQERPDHALKIGDITTRIGLDGRWVAANHGQSYAAFAIAPGDHRICVDWQSSPEALQKLNGAVNLSAQAGKTYFYRTVLHVQSLEQSPGLWFEAVDPAEGMLLLSKTGKSVWKEKK